MTTDLKSQFSNYMTLQRFADHTQRTYVTGVKRLAKFYMQSPDTLNNQQIQDYLLHLLKDRNLTWGTVNAYLSGPIPQKKANAVKSHLLIFVLGLRFFAIEFERHTQMTTEMSFV